jgi:hypothetical protein
MNEKLINGHIVVSILNVLFMIYVAYCMILIANEISQNKDKCENGCESYKSMISYNFVNKTLMNETCSKIGEVIYDFQYEFVGGKVTHTYPDPVCQDVGKKICDGRSKKCIFKRAGRYKSGIRSFTYPGDMYKKCDYKCDIYYKDNCVREEGYRTYCDDKCFSPDFECVFDDDTSFGFAICFSIICCLLIVGYCFLRTEDYKDYEKITDISIVIICCFAHIFIYIFYILPLFCFEVAKNDELNEETIKKIHYAYYLIPIMWFFTSSMIMVYFISNWFKIKKEKQIELIDPV